MLVKTKTNHRKRLLSPLQVGMLEIYNDEIYDLLNTAGSFRCREQVEL
jgi:hypothetical protein